MTGLAALPGPSERNLAVRVTPDAARRIRAGHPWVFDRSIRSTTGGRDGDGTAAAGDLAIVFDDDRRFLAVGLWDPASPIRIKVLHHGGPRPVDGALWHERVGAAVRRRRHLVEGGDTTGFRVVHGEDDGLPGLVVDRYADVAVVKLYTGAWAPHLTGVLAALHDLLHPTAVVLRLARNVPAAAVGGIPDGAVVDGSLPGPGTEVEFLELGLRFAADVVHGQKTGWFLDQRENRALVGGRAEGARVLDLCCAGGGFTVHAAAGGATEVHGVDRSRPALDAAVRNLERNQDRPAVARARHRSTAGDAFEVLEELGRRRERYDVVVVDPPSFASKQADVPGALRAHGRMAELALPLVAPGGTYLQSSCSARVDGDAFAAAVRRGGFEAGVRLGEVERPGQPVDHPSGFAEGEYLHTVVARPGA